QPCSRAGRPGPRTARTAPPDPPRAPRGPGARPGPVAHADPPSHQYLDSHPCPDRSPAMSTADPARIPPDPSDPSDLSAPPGPPERPGRPTPPAAAAPLRGRDLAWDPGFDAGSAEVTLWGFWASCWAGTAVNPAFLYGGILIFGTVIPAWTVLRYRREGWAGLGIRRRFL